MNNETQAVEQTPSTPAAVVANPKTPKAPKVAKPKAKKAMPKTSKKIAKKAKPKSAPGTMAQILHAAAKQYDKPKAKDGKPLKTAAGNPIIDSGDDVAKLLRGKDLKVVYELVGSKIGQSAQSLKLKYGKLNVGQQRMNLGNRLRGFLNGGKAKKAK